MDHEPCQRTFQILSTLGNTVRNFTIDSLRLDKPLTVMERIKKISSQVTPDQSVQSASPIARRLLISCPPESYDSGSSTCLPCSDLGLNCGQCTASGCTTCSVSYYMNGTGCQPCSTITNCLSCSNSTFCTSCYNYYYPDSNGACQSCSSSCYSCTSGTNCLNCDSAAYLVGGACTLCSVTISGCSFCTNGTVCEQCDANTNL